MRLLIVESMRNLFTALTAVMAIGGSLVTAAPASAESYYLVLGTYKQPDASGKPRVAQKSSPSITIIPMRHWSNVKLLDSKSQKIFTSQFGILMDVGHV